MTSPDSIPATRALGPYALLRALSADRTYLAADRSGRQVVLKILDSDCLLRGQLHPSIRQRLERVRELAHAGVANLHGVERDGNTVFAVWEFIEGQTLAERLASGNGSAELGREVLLAVESLHALGIVHGRIHGRNVIVDPVGRVHLTHVSPLLYDDPKADLRDVQAIFQDKKAPAVAAADETDMPAPRRDLILAGVVLIAAAGIALWVAHLAGNR